ncbi:MAG TPA: GNAT family N-acetyltransferase [Acidimicrobiales bacterium]|nr:GNAT family N-acetyltransferase [Acidimicrobiales bacterium]
MAWTMRPAAAEDVPELVTADQAAFGGRPSDVQIEESRAFLELDRTYVAVEGERIVGTAGALSMELTVPGPATVPVAGITFVGVVPTHRRRGILTALLARLIDDARDRQEPMSVLLASEATIYGRFGYGVAVTTDAVEIQRSHAALRRLVELTGRLRMLEPAEMAEVLPPLHDRYRRLQPGEVSRSGGWWARRLADREDRREGASARFAVLWEGAPGEEPSGYLTYRIRGTWDHGVPGHTLEVEELIALTPEVRAGLWQYCLNVDLVAVVKAGNVPVDEPLGWMLADSRRLRVRGRNDMLWLRLLDVEAALAGRTYASEGTVVLEVVDRSGTAAGRYRLAAGGNEEAVCRRTDRPADLALDVTELAAAFLGGARLTTLARAGVVSELTPGALARADALFASAIAPYCCTAF